MKHERLSGLYGITDTELLPDGNRLLDACESALRGGMRLLQYRDKVSSSKIRLEHAHELNRLCKEFDATFIINDDVELCKSVKADGVHIGQHDAKLTSARDYLGKDRLVGCSCYNEIDRALAAQANGADYIAFGRFFPSMTKPNAVHAEMTLFDDLAGLELPICAIGGITLKNAAELTTKPVDMLAVINALFSADDIEQRARKFCQIHSARSTD